MCMASEELGLLGKKLMRQETKIQIQRAAIPDAEQTKFQAENTMEMHGQEFGKY